MTEITISTDPASCKDFEGYIEELNDVPEIGVHIDVMDGIFVPRKSTTFPEFDYAVKNATHKLDVHLMVDNVAENINKYLAKSLWGTIRSISFHVENIEVASAAELFKKIKLFNISAGIAIDLPTKVADIDKTLIEGADFITIMSVKCGASGQMFDETALRKISQVKKINPVAKILVDGGINAQVLEKFSFEDVDAIIIGSAVYNEKNRGEFIANLRRKLDKTV